MQTIHKVSAACQELPSSSILKSEFFDKMLALSNQKSTFVLVSGFFGCCNFTILFKYYLKGHFLTKKAPEITIIIIFNAKLR